MQDAAAAVRILHQLKALRIRVAIDDFGTGYSSLAYLKRFAVDVLKIDRSFVEGLGYDARDSTIVQSVVVLGKSLGLSVERVQAHHDNGAQRDYHIAGDAEVVLRGFVNAP